MKAKAYTPKIIEHPDIDPVIQNKEDVWRANCDIIKDIISRFKIDPKLALDMGVLFGLSTSALSFYFEKVIGVDTFRDDRYDNSPDRDSNLDYVKGLLGKYPNIQLIESMWQHFAALHLYRTYDLIHLDMIHTYDETIKAGEWALQYSDVVLFHDAKAIPAVNKACEDLSDKFHFQYWRYNKHFGLGILVKI